MAVTWISERVGYQAGPVNVGVVRLHGDQALIVDAGLDPDRARKVMRDLDHEGLRARALVLTHSHADHIGGAALLRRRYSLSVAAPALEAGFMRYPSLEPFYLYGGAAAPGPLTGKFLQAERCTVDVEVEPGPWRIQDGGYHPARSGPPAAGRRSASEPTALRLELLDLAGHSPGQVGLAVHEDNERPATAIFCGDAVFPPQTWAKHGFVYFSDVEASLDTIRRLRSLSPATLVAGHGVALGDEVGAVLKMNKEGLTAASAETASVVEAHPEGISTEDILAVLTERKDARVETAPEYFLARATLHAHLARLAGGGRVSMSVERGRLRWVPAKT